MDAVVATIPGAEARGLSTNGKAELSRITLTLTSEMPVSSRGLLASNWNWDTVLWYVGVAAATTAALVVYKYTPWLYPVRKAIAGIAAIGGSIAMSAQLGLWANTAEGKFLIDFGKYSEPLVKAISSLPSKEAALSVGTYYIHTEITGIDQPKWIKLLTKLLEEYVVNDDGQAGRLIEKTKKFWGFWNLCGMIG